MELKMSYIKIFIPVLHRIGLLWTTESLNPAQEHFISNLVNKSSIQLLTRFPQLIAIKRRLYIFPDYEDHEIGLLMAKFILRQAGRSVIYLGQKVPMVNVKDTVFECNPSQLLFFLIQTRPTEFLQNYIDHLSGEFKSLKISCRKQITD